MISVNVFLILITLMAVEGLKAVGGKGTLIFVGKEKFS